MRGFIVVKNLKAPLEDVTSLVPEKNVDYMLLVDVALYQKVLSQVEVDDEDDDATFIFKPSGTMRLVKKDNEFRTETNIPELKLEDGHIVEYEAQHDSDAVATGDTVSNAIDAGQPTTDTPEQTPGV